MSEFVNTIDRLGDEAVTKALIERTITEFHDDVIVLVKRYAFDGCSALTSVNLPNVTTINDSAFRGCSNLVSTELPLVNSIGSHAFEDCSELESISIPLMKSNALGDYAFQRCSKLKTAYFPLLTRILRYVFHACQRRTIVKYISKNSCQ